MKLTHSTPFMLQSDLSPMRILFATMHTYPPQRAGGSESSTHDLCSALVAHSNPCAVLTALSSGDWLYLANRLKSRLTGRKFPPDLIHRYPVFRGWNPLCGVDEVISAFSPDIIVIQAGKPLPLAAKFSAKGIPTVIYLRDVAFWAHGGNYADHKDISYLANSSFTAESFRRQFGYSAPVIPPLVEPANYKVQPCRRYVVFISPTPKKGIELAFSLAAQNRDIPFLFVESWPLANSIRRNYISRAKRFGNIVWKRRQKDMKKVYREAKILLVPSQCDEAWGRVVTEAQISGIPILASNRGGLKESVGSGGIILDHNEKVDLWSYHLRKLWHDDHYYDELSQEALRHAARPEIKPECILTNFLSFCKATIQDRNTIGQH